jgi:large subunit ribosomal protein L9
VKVLLIQDVPGLGQVGDVKNVSDGYGRNYLIRRGLAKLATPGELKQVEQHKRTAAKQATRELADAQAMAGRLSGMTLTFKARAGEGTKLYGSITSGDIAEAISEQVGKEFDRRKIHLDESLRQLGTHQVTVRLTHDLTPEITVVIEREGEDEQETE